MTTSPLKSRAVTLCFFLLLLLSTYFPLSEALLLDEKSPRWQVFPPRLHLCRPGLWFATELLAGGPSGGRLPPNHGLWNSQTPPIQRQSGAQGMLGITVQSPQYVGRRRKPGELSQLVLALTAGKEPWFKKQFTTPATVLTQPTAWA